MTDLKERLGSIDDVPAPQDWASIASRTPLADLDTEATMAGFSEDARGTTWKRVATIAASLAIGLTAVAWVVIAIRPEGRPPSIGSVPAGTSRIEIAPAADGSLSASWTYGDAVRPGVPVDILGPGPTPVDRAGDQGSPRPGTVAEFLGVDGFSIDYGALGAVEPSPMSIPEDVPIHYGEDVMLLAFRAGEGQGMGYVEWGEMTVLRAPSDLQRLEPDARYRIVVIGRGTQDAPFQFAFDIDVTPSSAATSPDRMTLLVSSSGPNFDSALLSGTLTTENGCVVVTSGSLSTAVVWPKGYSLDQEDGVTWLLDDAGARISRIGDEIQMGGGSMDLANAEREMSATMPAPCVEAGPDAYWLAGTPDHVMGSMVDDQAPAHLPGIDAYRVCRVMSLPGDFGEAGDEVVVFEEERVPGAGCISSEGFQHIAVLRDGRVTALSRRITDLAGDDAWKVWPYATPDLDGDGTDEIVVAGTYTTGVAPRVWFFTLSPGGGGIEAIYEPGAVPDPSRTGAFTRSIASGIDAGSLRPQGVYCEGEGDARRIVTWEASRDGSLDVVETRWRLLSTQLEFVSESTVHIGERGYPDAGDLELCGGPVSPRESYP